MTPEARQALYETNNRLIALAQSGDADAAARLVETNGALVASLARRYMGRGTDLDDLIQIGTIGLIKAIRSFDLSRSLAFSTYAVPLILGEIRKFLRDDGLIKVSRTEKHTGAVLLKEREAFTAEYGREPHLGELAARCGVSAEEAADALTAVSGVRSFSDPVGDADAFTLEETIASGDNGIEKKTEEIALAEAIASLPEIWRKILLLRYYRSFSQQQTAEALGLTQVKISREEKKILSALRRELAR